MSAEAATIIAAAWQGEKRQAKKKSIEEDRKARSRTKALTDALKKKYAAPEEPSRA